MIVKGDAEHIVALPLMPVGTGPYTDYTVDGTINLGNQSFYPDLVVMLDGQKVVYHFKALIFSAQVIDSAQVCQIVEGKIRGIVKIGHYLIDPTFFN
jgi:hypothetical protein